MTTEPLTRWIWMAHNQNIDMHEQTEIYLEEANAIEAADEWSEGEPFTIHRVDIHPGKKYQRKLMEVS